LANVFGRPYIPEKIECNAVDHSAVLTDNLLKWPMRTAPSSTFPGHPTFRLNVNCNALFQKPIPHPSAICRQLIVLRMATPIGCMKNKSLEKFL
jgi:hypothetical protein